MRRLLFALVVILALLLGAEISLTLLCQKGLERALTRHYGLPSNLEASIGAFPFIVSLARNHLGELRLSWQGSCSLSSAAGESNISYLCVAFLYDVELDMPSLLRGSLRIDSLSRMQAHMELKAGEIAALLGMGTLSGAGPGDLLETRRGGCLYRYKVKVSGRRELYFSGGEVSLTEGEVGMEIEPMVYSCELRAALSALPLETNLKKACIEGEKIVLEISFPEWEGYLESSTTPLYSNYNVKLFTKPFYDDKTYSKKLRQFLKKGQKKP